MIRSFGRGGSARKLPKQGRLLFRFRARLGSTSSGITAGIIRRSPQESQPNGAHHKVETAAVRIRLNVAIRTGKRRELLLK